MTDRRKLSYRERWLDYEIGNMSSSDTDDDSVDNELQLPFSEKTPLALELTGEEYGKLFASASLGADLLYGEEAHSILWLLWKAAKVATLCEKVAGCVANSEDVQYELNLLAANEGNGGSGTPDEVLPEDDRTENVLSDSYDCDVDRLYATCRGVVQAVNDSTVEVFQAIEILTNPLELAAELADDIPLAGAVALAADTILWIQESAFEAYELAWSEVVKDELSCELFCLIKERDPCSLTLEDLMTVYADASFPDIPDIFAPWHEWALWLYGLPLVVAIETVKIGGLLGILCMRFGATFGQFSLGIRSLKTVVALLENDTDGDWAVLCTECDNSWIHEWDFAGYGKDDWEVDPAGGDGGVWTQGLGFEGTQIELNGNWSMHVNVLHWVGVLPIPDMTKFSIVYDMDRGGWNSGNVSFWMTVGGSTYEEWNSGYSTTVTGGIREIEFPLQDGVVARFYTRCSRWSNDSQPGSVLIRSVTMEGVGVDPFYGRVTADRHIGEV